MLENVIDAAFVGTSIIAGMTVGWWLKHWESSRKIAILSEVHIVPAVQIEEKLQTKKMVEQLQSLAADVAAQVGEHTSQVSEINSGLASPGGQSSEAVMAAIAKLVQANSRMQSKLESAERSLAEKSREIESHLSEARTDALTEINNRRAFDEEMQRCFHEFCGHGRPACVMMLDVDFFKKFNDTHGHKAGDEVLRHVARTLKNSIAGTEIVCRYGGEEFAVIFPGSMLLTAKAAAERARAAIGKLAIQFDGKMLRVNASAGLAEFMEKEDVEGVMKRADDALYVSKKNGRDCGHYHDGTTFIPFVPRNESAVVANPVVQAAPIVVPRVEVPVPVVAEKEDESAIKDGVTGLSSRTAYYEDLNRRVAEWKRGGEPLSVILMQIDNFPEFFASHGLSAEALILKASAQFLKATCRDMDHLARYGVDTFAMLLPTAQIQNAVNIAERIRKAVGKCKLPFQQGQLAFTVSLGVAEAVKGDSTSRLMQRASTSLNSAANTGGNLTFVHNGERAVSIEEFIPSPAFT